MLDAGPRFLTRLLVGFGDVDRPRDKDLTPALAPGLLPAFLVTGDLGADLGPGGMPGAGKDRIAVGADRREGIRRAGGDADRRQLVVVGVRRAGDVVEAVVFALIRKARVRPCLLNDVEDLGKALAALLVGHLIGVVSADDAATSDPENQ